MSGRTVIVTGAAGFVGSNVVEALVGAGYSVVAVCGRTYTPDGSAAARLAKFGVVDVRAADLGDAAAAARALSLGGERPEAILHVAGSATFWPPSHSEQTRSNVVATRNVVAAAAAVRARRLVFTSTAGAYGLHPGIRIDERVRSTASDSSVHYVRTKALAEGEVRRAMTHGIETVILGPASIVGRYDEKNWANVFRRVKAGRMPGVAPGRTSFCFAGAVADAHVAAIERAPAGESYLLGGADATFLEAVQIVGELLGAAAPRRPSPEWLVRAAGRASLLASYVTRREPMLTPEGVEYLVHRNVVDCTKAERDLGFRRVPLRTMLEDVHAWLLEAGRL